jgi:hypothetical protein
MDEFTTTESQVVADFCSVTSSLRATNTSLLAKVAELTAHVDSLQKLINARDQLAQLRSTSPTATSPALFPAPSSSTDLSEFFSARSTASSEHPATLPAARDADLGGSGSPEHCSPVDILLPPAYNFHLSVAFRKIVLGDSRFWEWLTSPGTCD